MEDIDEEIMRLVYQLIAVLRKTDHSKTKSAILWILFHTTHSSYEALGLLCAIEKQTIEHWDELMNLLQKVMGRYGILER